MPVEREKMIAAAMGEIKCDVVLKNARVVNVFSGDVHEGNVAILGDSIVGIGQYTGENEVDLDGQFVVPGFIDGHVHIESSMVSVPEFARAVLPNGTTRVIIDPHEITNVMGLDGIKFMIESSYGLPFDVHVMVPSCVPATHMETAGASLGVDDIREALDYPGVLGLAEVMNFPGVIFRDKEVMSKLRVATGKVIDGHAPMVGGKQLCAYACSGISSDHESTNLQEAKEKLLLGMRIFIREGTSARNLDALLPLVTAQNSRRFSFVTDDRHPHDLLRRGHINEMVKRAVEQGLPAPIAVQMATINTAEYFRIPHVGAIAPGYVADILVLENLEDFRVSMTFKNGRLVFRSGEGLRFCSERMKAVRRMNVKEGISFEIPARSKRIRVVNIVPEQILTRASVESTRVVDGRAVADVQRDILKLAVVERHHGTGNVGLGFAKGFGIKRGAIGSSVAHDSHNIVIVGTNDDDMKACLDEIIRLGGGLVAALDGKVLASLPLPIAGLMSNLQLEEVEARIRRLNEVQRQALGGTLPDPFMKVSFLALPVIPELRLTDRGLVDVSKFGFVSLFE